MAPGRITVECAPGPGGPEGLVAVRLARGARIGDLLAALGVAVADGAGVGIWGRRAEPGTVLEDGDRVEVYRPLRADPKLRRRARAVNSGRRKPAPRSRSC